MLYIKLLGYWKIGSGKWEFKYIYSCEPMWCTGKFNKNYIYLFYNQMVWNWNYVWNGKKEKEKERKKDWIKNRQSHINFCKNGNL